MIGLTYGNFSSSGAGFDPDAQAFITAAGITGETQQSALNQLVLDLKGTGSTTNNTDVWSDLHAVYPMCPIDGSTATRDAYKWNLKDPRDLDAAFRITWFNDPTASINGISGNGTSQYGNTHLNFLSVLSEDNVSISETTDSLNNISMGLTNGQTFFQINQVFSNIWAYNGKNDPVRSSFLANTSHVAISNRTSDISHKLFINGINSGEITSSLNSIIGLDCYILCRNLNGSPNTFSSSTYKFFTIGNGLTNNQAKDLYDSISTYNSALGR